MTMFASTLDEALEEIARRSFYESVKVVPVSKANKLGEIYGYLIEDGYGANIAEDWFWSREGGVEGPSVDDASTLMAADEAFLCADHVRYNLQGAVSALEEGKAVTFAYAIVTDAELDLDEDGFYADATGETYCDDIAGWLLAAKVWED